MTLPSPAACLRVLCRSAAGVALAIGATAWLALAVRETKGLVPAPTAISVGVTYLAAGWLINRDRTIELSKFLLSQLREWAAAIIDALKGSGGPPPNGGAAVGLA